MTNVEDPVTFNDLVDDIKQSGFGGAIEVVPLGDGVYRIIGGEHRWKAAKLAGLKAIPVSLHFWDEDLQKIETVKRNLLHGKLDPHKFTTMFLALEKKYGRDNLRKLMGLGQRDAMFRQLMKDVTKGLPERVQNEIEKRADKIRNVEDLAAVVNALYSKFGATLDHSYMLFSFGGRTHLMVKMDAKTFSVVRKLVEGWTAEEKDVNEEIVKRLT